MNFNKIFFAAGLLLSISAHSLDDKNNEMPGQMAFADGCYVSSLIEGMEQSKAKVYWLCASGVYARMNGYKQGTAVLQGGGSFSKEANLGVQSCHNLVSDQYDSQWWEGNKPKAIDRRREYNECVLKHIGSASTGGAVSQVRYSCRQLHWPHEWPEKYLTQPVPN